ncbi:MAG: MATE family efflux transporter [Ramlibacter sp.]
MPAPNLLQGRILPTLVRLAVPNVIAMAASTAVGIAETLYVGLLGKTALAAMALVFPFVMLMQMFSAGAMGGGVSSAVSRSLGSGNRERANQLATHAVFIGAGAGLFFTVLLLTAGPWLYRLLGGTGEVLQLAAVYSAWVFCATPAIWLLNTLISVVRGTGDMRVPSLAILAACALQIAFGASLCFGLAGMPRLGMTGIALGQVIAFYSLAALLWWYLVSGRAALRLSITGVPLRAEMFRDILRVGALACLSPLLTVGTILVVTSLVARHGNDALAGYGIGARLEFLLVPIAFGVGVASVPMVGMAIGAGMPERARRVAWTAAGLSAAILGSMGLLLAMFPLLWAGVFTTDAAVLAKASEYLRFAGPGFAFFGLGLTLYFSAQGAGNVRAPVLASLLRFAFVLAAGSVLAAMDAPTWAFFGLVGAAMVVYGGASALGVHLAVWKAAPNAA